MMERLDGIDNVLYRIIRYGLIAALFTPLIIIRETFSPFNVGKAIVVRMIIEVLLVAWIPLMLKYPHLRPFRFADLWRWFRRLRLDCRSIIVGLLFVGASWILSTVAGVNISKSVWGEWERMGGLFAWLHYLAFFLMALSVFRRREEWSFLLGASVVAAVLSAVYGFVQRTDFPFIVGAEERFRIIGTIGNPAAFAGYILMNFWGAVVLFVRSSGRATKTLLAGALVVFAVAIVMTAVRGAFIALVASAAVFLILLLRERRRMHYSATKITVFLVVLAVVGVVVYAAATAGVFEDIETERLLRYTLDDKTVQDRLTVWGIALNSVVPQSISDIPKILVGWGPENVTAAFSVHYDPAIFEGTDSRVFDRAHNIVLDVLVTRGVVGLLAFVLLWGGILALIITTPRLEQRERYALLSFVVAYGVHTFFFFDLTPHYIMLMVFFGVLYTATGNEMVDAEQIESSHPSHALWKTVVPVSLLAGAVGGLLWWANIKPLTANRESVQASLQLREAVAQAPDPGYEETFAEGVGRFRNAVGNAAWMRTDVLRKFSEVYTGAVFDLGGRINKEDLYATTEYLVDALARQRHQRSQEFPSWIYEYKTQRVLALYRDEAVFDAIAEKQQKAVEQFPRVPELYYDLADSYYYRDKFPSAADALERAYHLNPNVGESVFGLGRAYLLMGEHDKGLNRIKQAVRMGYRHPDDVRWLGRFLEENAMYESMIDVFTLLASQEKSYTIYLSYAYLLAGDVVTAKELADAASRLPLNKDQNEILFRIYRGIQRREAVDN